jgi:hypothetical protein
LVCPAPLILLECYTVNICAANISLKVISLQLKGTRQQCGSSVGAAVTLLESMMAEVAHLNSVEQHITAAIKNSIDVERIRCTGCSLHHL